MAQITPEIEEKLINIAQQFLKETEGKYSQRKITLISSIQSHLGIDSLGRTELFHRIEKSFGVKFPDNLIVEAETLEDIAKTITNAPHSTQKIPTLATTKPNIEKIFVDTSSAKTLIDLLLLYVAEVPNRKHVYLQEDQGKETTITYKQLLDRSLCVANAFHKMGLTHGDTVAIMLPTCAGFLYTFFGALLAGGIPVPIYPPFRLHQIEAYAKQEAKILQNTEAKILVTFKEAKAVGYLLRSLVPAIKEVVICDSLLEKQKAPIYKASPEDIAFIQYTSGSTGIPKGVVLTHANLLANIRAYSNAIKTSSEDVTISWLPLYHDLGLIGKWLGSLYCGAPLILFSPMHFLNRPEQWLWAIHYFRGTISAGPNFAYRLCAQKIEPATIEGLDLSSWRLAICGAETIHPNTIEQFTERYRHYGFNPTSFLPVYGLAETSLGLTTPPLRRAPWIDIIERKAFEEKDLAIPVTDGNKKNCLEFVSCGKPLSELEVRIVDNNHQELPERHIGHLEFKGPSCMQGYYRNPEATAAAYHDGWWKSGDLAYKANGEFIITGRQKDIIIKAGRNLSPTEIEEITTQVDGIRQGCVIAFSVPDEQKGTEKLVIIAETREKNTARNNLIIEQINEKLGNAIDVTPDEIILVQTKTIPKTSSGKLQRAACKTAYLQGQIGKKSLPAWAQLAKLGLKWVGREAIRILSTLGKIVYSIYVFSLFGISLLPVWLSLFFLSRKIAIRICKPWIKFLSNIAFCPIKINGQENLAKAPVLIFAVNHTSYLDAVVMIGMLPANTRFVGKKELLKVPVLRTFMKKLDHFAIDRADFTNAKYTQEMEQALLNGSSILIFPEGTFGYATGLRPFKSGAFKMATETNIPVCPIAIKGTRNILRGHDKLLKPGKIEITICQPIFPKGTDWVAITQLKNSVYTEIAKYCGEPTLDFIVPKSIAAPKN